MTAEIIFIGSMATFFATLAIREWNASRCPSKQTWFHDWKRDEHCAETTQNYNVGSHSYTATWGMFECVYCNKRRDMCINTTEPQSDIDD